MGRPYRSPSLTLTTEGLGWDHWRPQRLRNKWGWEIVSGFDKRPHVWFTRAPAFRIGAPTPDMIKGHRAGSGPWDRPRPSDVTCALDPRATATDRLEAESRPLCCRWFSDRDLVPAQRRALPRAFHAATPGGQSFLRRSAARNKVCSPRRSAW